MLGRAYTAFRNTVTRSKSSSTLTISEKDIIDDSESVISSISSSKSMVVIRASRSNQASEPSTAERSEPSSSLSFLRRRRQQRRSRSTNPEGDFKRPKQKIRNFLEYFLFL